MMQIEIRVGRKNVALATISNCGDFYDCVMEYTTKDGEAVTGNVRIDTAAHDRHTQSAVKLAALALMRFVGMDDRFCTLYAHGNPYAED
jgi:hypothetical protein